MANLALGLLSCSCTRLTHPPRRIALTGGPGAGKTAVLEMARHALCRHVAILPEAAGIVFGGGFPRHTSEGGRRAAQRAIFHVQREVEALVDDEQQVAIALCDRGTLDGLAYWPGKAEAYWSEVGTSQASELARYAAVIHLQTPGAGDGYNRSNLLRVESPEEAIAIDNRIADAWKDHPRRFVVKSTSSFVDKARAALELVRAELPPCCQSHPLVPPQ